MSTSFLKAILEAVYRRCIDVLLGKTSARFDLIGRQCRRITAAGDCCSVPHRAHNKVAGSTKRDKHHTRFKSDINRIRRVDL